MYPDINSDIPTLTISDIYSANLFGDSIGHGLWHSIWHFVWMAFYLTFFWHIFWQSIWQSICLAIYRTHILTYYLWHTNSDILSGILSKILSGFLYDILTFFLAIYLAFYLTIVLTFYLTYMFDILSRILPGILSDILFCLTISDILSDSMWHMLSPYPAFLWHSSAASGPVAGRSSGMSCPRMAGGGSLTSYTVRSLSGCYDLPQESNLLGCNSKIGYSSNKTVWFRYV